MFWKKEEQAQAVEAREAGAAAPAESSHQQPKPCCSKRTKQQVAEPVDEVVKIGSAPKGTLVLIGNCKPSGGGDTIAACQWRVTKSTTQQPKPQITIFF